MGNNPVSVILCSPYRARIPDDILKCIINMCVCVLCFLISTITAHHYITILPLEYPDNGIYNSVHFFMSAV